ncbi:hypothetical protein [Paenibacillus bouchesdurhonensis]|uniref:hypothetical protein n=1 Tax=Paenibacillus bouchesdurhonensis TaxID=1870990 RepID=UPI000DA5F923|nr:hypothetical protein [Paenibacillus bouchesdurhonensis]
MNRCKMPKCRGVATKTWAMMGLCKQCHADIKKETNLFYSGKILANDRVFHKKLQMAKGERIV